MCLVEFIIQESQDTFLLGRCAEERGGDCYLPGLVRSGNDMERKKEFRLLWVVLKDRGSSRDEDKQSRRLNTMQIAFLFIPPL